jgi:hypothetical protein
MPRKCCNARIKSQAVAECLHEAVFELQVPAAAGKTAESELVIGSADADVFEHRVGFAAARNAGEFQLRTARLVQVDGLIAAGGWEVQVLGVSMREAVAERTADGVVRAVGAGEGQRQDVRQREVGGAMQGQAGGAADRVGAAKVVFEEKGSVPLFLLWSSLKHLR